MTKTDPHFSPSELRHQAEEQVRARHKTGTTLPQQSESELRRLLHELEVYQVQLEIQNEELQRSIAEQEKLEAQVGTYADLYDFAPVGYLTLDQNNLICAANLTAAGFLRTERSRLIGQRFDHYLSQESVSAFTAFQQKAYSSQKKNVVELSIAVDGPPARFVQVEGEIMHPGEKQRIVLTDISARKQAEEALQESELSYRTIGETIDYGTWSADAKGSCTYVSDSFLQMTGMTWPEIQQFGWLHLLFPEDRESTAEHWRLCVETGANYQSEYQLLQKNGKICHVLAIGRPVRNVNNEITRWVGINLDITDRKQRENVIEQLNAKLAKRAEELEHSNQMKSQFLANMSHELRTPMTTILGLLDLTLEGDLSNEQHNQLKTVEKASKTLLRILNDILDFSRIEAGMANLVEEAFLLHETVGVVAELYKLEAESNNVTLRMDIATNVPKIILGDEDRIQQILINLVDNAVKFTNDGDVTIRLAVGETFEDNRLEVILTVVDSGIGIPSESQEMIFDPFAQVDVSHSRRFSGTGLGLAICNKVVNRMGGSISLSSAAGKGSTFVVTLPLQQVQESQETAPVVKSQRPFQMTNGLDKPKLLIAEDSQDIRSFLKLLLTREGMKFDIAVNGHEVVKMWSRESYDLILMDVQMPLMDGFEAAQVIRKQEESRGGHIPIIALTAHVYDKDQNKCFAAGMDAFVAKPINSQSLFKVVADLLGDAERSHG